MNEKRKGTWISSSMFFIVVTELSLSKLKILLKLRFNKTIRLTAQSCDDSYVAVPLCVDEILNHTLCFVLYSYFIFVPYHFLLV